MYFFLSKNGNPTTFLKKKPRLRSHKALGQIVSISIFTKVLYCYFNNQNEKIRVVNLKKNCININIADRQWRCKFTEFNAWLIQIARIIENSFDKLIVLIFIYSEWNPYIFNRLQSMRINLYEIKKDTCDIGLVKSWIPPWYDRRIRRLKIWTAVQAAVDPATQKRH